MIKNNQKMSKLLFWIDDWFRKKQKITAFSNLEQTIYDEICEKWDLVDRIELLNTMKMEHGKVVISAINKLVRTNLTKEWSVVAKEKGDNSLESFVSILWGPLKEQGFVYTQKKIDATLQFCVTKCPIADLAEEIGAQEWIFELVCNGDNYMVEGFNSDIDFKRDKTLPQGFKCCNHSYTVKK